MSLNMSDKIRIAGCQEQLTSTLKRMLLLHKHGKLETEVQLQDCGWQDMLSQGRALSCHPRVICHIASSARAIQLPICSSSGLLLTVVGIRTLHRASI